MYYKLQVSETSAFSELSVNKIVEEVTEDVITYGLDANIKYFWRVRSINNITGKESDWSELCYFRTRPDNIMIGQGGTDAGNIIIFEIGNNKASTCTAPDGKIADKLCKSNSNYCDATIGVTTVGGDTLESELCDHCSELL